MNLICGAVNTAVFERNGRKLLIDSGELTSLPGGGAADWVLVTHHHRDQASGVGSLIDAGAKLIVPKLEAELFSKADEFWKKQNVYWFGSFRPSHFTLRESVKVTRAVADGDVVEWEGLRFEAIHTPGHTDGSMTYLVDIGGKRIAFVGDLIYGQGQLWEMYSLQEKFDPRLVMAHLGFGGAAGQLKASLDKVLARKPDLLIPSHGPVITNPTAAVEKLKKNLDAVMDNYLTTVGWPDFGDRFEGVFAALYPDKQNLPRLAPLPAVSLPPWILSLGEKTTSQVIVGDDGSAFVSDAGNREVLAELANLLAQNKIKKLDGIWITHYHIDHCAMANAVRRALGGEVYAQQGVREIIENPAVYNMPASHPEPIRVDHAMRDGESLEWKGIKLTFFHFPGQTLYHGGLLAEKDGFKAFFTGDSWANWGIEDYCSQFRNFIGKGRGYDRCLKILLQTHPDILVQAHRGPMAVTRGYLQKTRKTLGQREALCRRLLPHDDPNFGLDPYWARGYPYRQAALPGSRIELELRVTNHSTRPSRIEGRLHVPKGWGVREASEASTIGSRSEGRIRFEVIIPDNAESRRYVLGLAVTKNGQPLGELGEAIVDIAQKNTPRD